MRPGREPHTSGARPLESFPAPRAGHGHRSRHIDPVDLHVPAALLELAARQGFYPEDAGLRRADAVLEPLAALEVVHREAAGVRGDDVHVLVRTVEAARVPGDIVVVGHPLAAAVEVLRLNRPRDS